MKVLTPEFQNKVEAAAGINFTVTATSDKALSFENVYFDHGFYLYFEFLNENEVLKVTELLKEIFENFPQLSRLTEQKINLNIPRKNSADFVRAVLSIQGSAFHKFLLLTSGRHLLWKMSVDQVTSLAKAKMEVCSLPQTMAQSATHFRALKQLYILPGVSSETLVYGGLPEINSMNTSAVENTVKIMAFMANNSKISFSEHLKLDFAESIATQNNLPFFGEINSIQRLLQSPQKSLAESMNASHLSALSSFITKSVQDGIFPERILRNRAAALASASFSPYDAVMASVFSLLSDEERSRLESDEFVDDLDFLITRAKIGADTPLIVYAALAEVLAVKGVNKAFEVAREMNHFNSEKEFDLKHYEATVAIIDEALNPENDDFPFSWYSQLSEHAWVLTSHLSAKELALKV
jgi:hypothetical protein